MREGESDSVKSSQVGVSSVCRQTDGALATLSSQSVSQSKEGNETENEMSREGQPRKNKRGKGWAGEEALS